MSGLAQERSVVRGLAAQLAEVAALPVQRETAELWRRLNRLDPVRPMVILQMLEDSAWLDTGVADTLVCADPFLRRQELVLRRLLYQWKHQAGDMVIDDVVSVPIAIHSTGPGVQAKFENPDHSFGAARFLPVLVEETDAAQLRIPEVSVDWEDTERRYQQHAELYDGLLRVEQLGRRDIWYSIFDTFIEWRGVEQAFVDMLDRPEWVHRVLDRMTAGHMAELDAYERLGVLSLNNNKGRIGPGGEGFTDELPQPDFDGVHVRPKDVWGTASTQIFVDVSPAMHEEFALQYESRLLTRFGLSCYGCCEPLHHKVEITKRHLPNLRRISMSPWADVAVGAAAVGKDLIFSYKPNPAIMAGETWDLAQVRADLRHVFEVTRGCCVEVLMKDLHTCHGHPERMEEWTRIARELAQEFAA